MIRLSILLPCYNEEASLPTVLEELLDLLDREGLEAEVVVVDDGSLDGTFAIAADWVERDARVKALRLRRNFGQTAALVAAMDHASGELLIPMDADGQNDPADIPALLTRLDNEGVDVVSGWRVDRKDPWLSRRLPSKMANWLISKISGVPLHDYGCTLKVYRSDVMGDVRLYGEMHRFIPIYAAWAGAKVVEQAVNHRPRTAGRSKYGLGRTFKVLLDLITVTLLSAYSTKPLYFFGLVGLALCSGGVVAGAETLVEKFMYGVKVHTNPVILLAVFLFLSGLQCVFIGLLAELMIRTYHESTGREIYKVGQYKNLQGPP